VKRLLAVFAFVGVGAGIALAAPDVDPWVNITNPWRFMRPTNFEQETRFAFLDAGTVWQNTDHSTTAQVDSTLTVGIGDAGSGSLVVNGFTFTLKGRGTLVYDFPALTGTPSGSLDTVCASSSAGTATGCAFGDSVLLGIDQVLPNYFGTITAYVSASSAFVVQACANGFTDGGAFNMPDASYTVTCVR